MCSLASVESIAGQVVADYIYCDERDGIGARSRRPPSLKDASGTDATIDAGCLALGVR